MRTKPSVPQDARHSFPKIPLTVGQGHVLESPEQSNYHAKKVTILRSHSTDGETIAGWGAVARSPDGRLYVMFGPVVTTEAHLAYAEARTHTNNTAKLSSIIKALSFLGLAGPVDRGLQACIFYDSKATDICLGMVQTRTNVPLGLLSQQLLYSHE